MSLESFDFTNLVQFLEKNKDFLDTFFKQTPFNEDYFKRAMKNGFPGQHAQNEENIHDTDVSTSSLSKQKIPMDMIQRKHEILLIFEIPGLISKEDVNIKVIGSTLSIEGETKRSYMLSNKDKTKLERKTGHFSRKVTLPGVYDAKRIKARYNNGLLEVRIPVLKPFGQENISVVFPD